MNTRAGAVRPRGRAGHRSVRALQGRNPARHDPAADRRRHRDFQLVLRRPLALRRLLAPLCAGVLARLHHAPTNPYRATGQRATTALSSANGHATTTPTTVADSSRNTMSPSWVSATAIDRRSSVRFARQASTVRCWGYGWDEGRIDHDGMVRTFETSRINLNLSNSWTGTWWRRRQAVGQIKARVFEVPGSGGFLLSEAVPHVERYFAVGEELATFEGTGDLIEKIRFWLGHEQERAQAADNGYARVRAEHTYDHRFAEIFEVAGLRGA